jgi:sugar/nucleoside kinase (ribokinase family)
MSEARAARQQSKPARQAKTRPATDKAALCVAGLAYFEAHLPSELAFVAGRERFVDGISLTVGGALNTASVAHALGLSVSLAYPAGAGLADRAIASVVDSLGIEVVVWQCADDPAISLVQAGAGDRAFVSAANFDALTACPALPNASWLHVPGLYEARALETQLACAVEAGSRVSLAGSWAPALLDDRDALFGLPWQLLVLNDDEAKRLTGCADAEAACKRLATRDRDVVITSGQQRIIASFGQAPYSIAPSLCTSAEIDTTGAGDAFCAGLIAALLDQRTPNDALRFASDVAARSVTQRGGTTLDARRYRDLVDLPAKGAEG